MKMMEDKDMVPDNVSCIKMNIKLEPSELLEHCSTCGKGFKSKKELLPAGQRKLVMMIIYFQPNSQLFLLCAPWCVICEDLCSILKSFG